MNTIASGYATINMKIATLSWTTQMDKKGDAWYCYRNVVYNNEGWQNAQMMKTTIMKFYWQ